MMTADDHFIYAQAKDTIEAMKEFEAAVARVKAAALQEQVSGDSQSFIHPKQWLFTHLWTLVFRISLGSIPAQAKIKIKTVVRM